MLGQQSFSGGKPVRDTVLIKDAGIF